VKKSSVVTGMVAAAFVSSMAVAGSGGPAAAEELAVLTVTPLQPSEAEVCWTEFTPDAGTVTAYQLRVPERSLLPATVSANSCTTLGELKTATKYTFILEAQIDGAAEYVEAAPTVEAKAYSLSSELSRTKAKAGQEVTVSGTLKAVNPIPEAKVIVQQRVKPSDQWQTLGKPVKTNSNGRYSRTFTVKSNVSIRTYFTGLDAGPATTGAWNPAQAIDVSPVFSLSFSKNPVRLGKTVTAKGEVTAGDLGALAGDKVCLQKKQGGSWGNGVCVPIGADGRFQTRVTPTSKKDLYYRWWAASVAPEYVAGGSPPKQLTVK
jgi:hypothetical protein